jgi:hypothetical protein
MDDRREMFGFIDRIYFKPTDNGWLFKEPAFWRRRTFLLTDSEKMRLVRPMRWLSLVSLILIIVAIEAQDFLSDRFHISFGWGMAVAVVLATVAAWSYVNVVLRPLLSGLTPTTERITFLDQFRMQAAALPVPLMTVWLIAALGFVILGLGIFFHGSWNWEDAIGIALFATIAVYPAALLVVRARQSRASRR